MGRFAPGVPRILAWSGWDHSNIGDVGHTPGLLRTLEEFVPEAPVTLVANQLDLRTRGMLARRFPAVEVHEGGLWEDDDTGRRLRGLLDGGDVGLFVRASNMGSETAFMDELIGRGVPFGVYGQTYFPWFVERGEETRRGLDRIRRAAFFYCRETLTLGMLERALGDVRPPHLRFMPDCCFGIDVREDAGAESILRRAGLEPGRFLTVQLRTKTPAHLPEELPPGYRPEWNRPVPDEALDTARADKFVHLITAWVRGTGLRALIAPEAKKEMAHNRRLIVDRLPADVRPAVATLETFWSVMEAASVFRQARVVVCHEPHSPILALANGVPAVHTYSLEHSPKYHMFADLGLSEWLLDHDRMTQEQLVASVMGIHEGYDAALARVSACMAEVHRLRRESMRVVREVLGV